MTTTYISLGGNLGPVSETIRRAFGSLAEHPRVHARQLSSVYRTSAVGEGAGDDFLNAAARIDSDLPPRDFLQLLQSVETTLGRTRDYRWAPRTLDLDLILYGDQIIDLPALRVPHPACWYRRFVLEPLAEIAPNVVHPEKGQTIRHLRDRLLFFPFRLALSGADEHVRKRLIDRLAGEFKNVEIVDWSAQNSVDPTILIWLGRPSDEPHRSAAIDDSVITAWLDASRMAGEVEQFLREVLQSALGAVERTNSD